ncbi:type 1 glutamine amidotransferase domain-containing protein [Klenkia sp. LSe6-5]|uniref:Type 1 glutamine amidotransferase domain-containing protein n=1 Tax=Klenkia sesuvii TaxID=3103137 RepID=A0ABU8DZP8_9ACTN
MAELTGKTIAILAAKGVEQIELDEPRKAVEAAGATVHLLSVPDGVEDGTVQGVNGDIHPGDTYPVDHLVADVAAADYDGLLLPGGAVNPDTLRQDGDALAFVTAFFDAGKPVAAICHAPWTLLEAGVLEGRTLTSYPSIRGDLRRGGATVVDQEVCRDGNLVTSRNPDDVPAFARAAVELFAGS